MLSKRRPTVRRAALLLVVGLSASWAAGQTTRIADSRLSRGLPADVRGALEQIEDFSFSFAQPGFYALLEYLKTTSGPPDHPRESLEIGDWSVLLERPADFRGLAVTIEGVVGRNKAWRFQQEERRHLGTVWQLELWRADQPIAVTLILTNDASDIPRGATIRVTGYFVMMRQYYSEAKRLRQSALLVAHGPTLVSQVVAQTRARSGANWIVGLVAAGTVALLVIWLLLRRSVGRARRTVPAPRATGSAPVSLADDLAAWAAEQPEPAAEDEERNSTDRT